MSLGCAESSAPAGNTTTQVLQGTPASPFVGQATLVMEAEYVPLPSRYVGPAVAAGGTGYLAVAASTTDSRLRAIKVAGGVVDPRPISIDEQTCSSVDLFWSGTDYVLFCTAGSVFAYRVGSDDAPGPKVTVFEPPPLISVLSIAKGDDHYLLAWARDEVIWGLLLRDEAGSLTRVIAEPFVIGEGPGRRQSPSVVWLGDSFFVVYEDNRFVDVPSDDIRGTLVATDGSVDTTDGNELFADPGAFEQVQLTISGGPGALLLYSKSDEVRSVVLDAEGVPDLTTDRAHPNFGDADTGWGGAWTGNQWFVKGESNSDVVAVPVDGSFPAVRVAPSISSDFASAMAWSGNTGLLVSRDDNPASTTGSLLLTQVFDETGPTGEPEPLVTLGLPFSGARIASDGVGYGVFYGRNQDRRRVGLPLDLAGARAGDPVTSNGTVSDQRVQSLAPGRFMTAIPGSPVRLRRFDYEFGLQPSLPIEFTITVSGLQDCCPIDLASSDDGLLLVVNTTGPDLLRVNPDGSLQDEFFSRLSASGAPIRTVSAAGAGGDYLVSFKRNADEGVTAGLYAARVRHADRQTLDRDAIQLSLAPANPRGARVVGGDDWWVVAWWDDPGIGFATIDADGAFISGPATIATSLIPDDERGTRDEIHGAFGGTYSLLAWAHGTDGEAPAISAALVDPTDTEPPALLANLVEDPDIEQVVGVASTGGDQFVIAYTRFHPELNAPQMYTRVVSPTTLLGESCASDADCGTNPCVDGVCCNTACGGGDPADCLACSVAAGGGADGACTPRGAGQVCRSTTGVCDATETCDGDAVDCPADAAVPNGTGCDDGTVCNGVATCQGGSCVPGDPPVCDDGNACTADTCHPSLGCNNTVIDCDDGDLCSQNSCDPVMGCLSVPQDCEDGNLCTDGVCDPDLGCVQTPIVCADGDLCTVDGCDAGFGCTFSPVDCDDGDACTLNACEASNGSCTSVPVDCDDGDVCTENFCDPATGCGSRAISCDDTDPCTADSCDALLGCTHEVLDCDDGDACTADSCDSVGGCRHDAIRCDDDDACTADSCDPEAGCLHTDVPDCRDPPADPIDDDASSGCAAAPIGDGGAGSNLLLGLVGCVLLWRRRT